MVTRKYKLRSKSLGRLRRRRTAASRRAVRRTNRNNNANRRTRHRTMTKGGFLNDRFKWNFLSRATVAPAPDSSPRMSPSPTPSSDASGRSTPSLERDDDKIEKIQTELNALRTLIATNDKQLTKEFIQLYINKKTELQADAETKIKTLEDEHKKKQEAFESENASKHAEFETRSAQIADEIRNDAQVLRDAKIQAKDNKNTELKTQIKVLEAQIKTKQSELERILPQQIRDFKSKILSTGRILNRDMKSESRKLYNEIHAKINKLMSNFNSGKLPDAQ